MLRKMEYADFNWAFTRYDRRSDRSVRLVGPTGQSDDQTRCSVGGTCCLRHSYIAATVIYTSGG